MKLPLIWQRSRSHPNRRGRSIRGMWRFSGCIQPRERPSGNYRNSLICLRRAYGEFALELGRRCSLHLEDSYRELQYLSPLYSRRMLSIDKTEINKFEYQPPTLYSTGSNVAHSLARKTIARKIAASRSQICRLTFRRLLYQDAFSRSVWYMCERLLLLAHIGVSWRGASLVWFGVAPNLYPKLPLLSIKSVIY